MQLPARIGKYELEEFLGGGMSHVYRARDTVIGRTVAVKILTAAGCEDAEAKARFLAEARMAGNISHDNILSIYDFGEDDQHHPFMVMEFLKGQDLRRTIKGGQTGALRDKLRIALQVARALEYIHTQKIIHRDIKPENINISPEGVVKLMDFGIAKTEGLQMTRAGYVLGTPHYMAPEQVTGQNITEQVDVYAFGVLLFELFAGVKPIGGESVERIFYSILNEPLNLEPLRTIAVPEPVIKIVAACTLKNPAERPQGFAPVCTEISRILTELDAPTVLIPAASPATPPPPARPAWLVPAIIGLVAVLGIGLYFALRPGAPPPAAPSKPVELAKTIESKSGTMLLVTPGDFLFGEQKQSTPMPAFYVDKTEVTNTAYAAFCKAANYPLPEGFPPDKPDFPVVNVTILDAKQFADWAGERIPNAKEWEKAARGADGRLFPWGDQKDASLANIGPDGKLGPVDAFPNGASPFGALQMVGNVFELINEPTTPSDHALHNFPSLQPPVTPSEPWFQIRGGSFNDRSGLVDGELWDETTVPARWKSGNIGFRCVKDPPK